MIIAAAWFVYSPAFHGSWLWDDFEIPQNPQLHDWPGLAKMWYAPDTPDYYPLKTTVQWVQWHLWHEDFLGYHLTNVALHVLSAFLLWRVLGKLSRLTPSAVRWGDASRDANADRNSDGVVGVSGTSRPTSKGASNFLAALLFVVHPLAVESVAWIAELKNVLSLVFLLLAMLSWIDWDDQRRRVVPARPDGGNEAERLVYVQGQSSENSAKRGTGFQPVSIDNMGWKPMLRQFRSQVSGFILRRRSYLLSLLYFLAAMLSKSSVVVFPAILLLYAWWRRGRIGWSDIKASVPFFAVSVALGAITVWFQVHRAVGHWNLPQATFPARLADAGRAIEFYFIKCVFPRNLMPIYPPWPPGPLGIASFLPSLVIIGVFVALIRWAGASPRRQIASANEESPGADEASPGRAAPHKVAQASRLPSLTSAGKDACSTSFSGFRFQLSAFSKNAVFALGCFVLFLLPVLGFVPMAYQHIAPVADHLCYLPLVTLIALAAAGRPVTWHGLPARVICAMGWKPMLRSALRSALLTALVVTLALTSRNYAKIFVNQETLWSYNLAHNTRSPAIYANLGFIQAHDGQFADAIRSYQQAIRLDPDDAQVEFELAGIYLDQNHAQAAVPLFNQAIDHYKRALRIDPEILETRRALAEVLAKAGRTPEAITQYEQVLRQRPDDAVTENDLGKALGEEGRAAEAIAHYEKALRLDPAYAQAENSLGLALVDDGRPREGMLHLHEALRLDPSLAEAENNLGFALAGLGRQPEAVSHFQEALRLKPGFGQAENNLAFSLASLGRRPEAIAHLERALQLAPDDPKAQYNLAVLLNAAGRSREAIAHLEIAVKLKPDFDAARTALARLRLLEVAAGK